MSLKTIVEGNLRNADPYFEDKLDEMNTDIRKYEKQLGDLATNEKNLESNIAKLEKKLEAVAARFDPEEALKTLKMMERSKTRIQKVADRGKNLARTHHSSPLEGGDVGGAGTFKSTGGKITEISNVSGHYKPKYVHLAQTIEQLMRMGALLDKTPKYVDADGNLKDLETDNPKLYDLWEEINEQLPNLEDYKEEVEKTRRELDTLPEDMDEEALEDLREELEETLEDMQGKMKRIRKGLEVLRKMGVGAANKADAKVEFLEGMEGKKGAEIHAMKGKSGDLPRVDEFLNSGGGQKVYDKHKGAYTETTVAQAKANLLDELRKITAETGNVLDRDADERNRQLMSLLKKRLSPQAYKAFLKKTKAPTAEQIEELLEGLRASDFEEEKDEYDEEALRKRLDELGAKGLKDAFFKLKFNEEDYLELNQDKWRRKVVMGEMTWKEANAAQFG